MTSVVAENTKKATARFTELHWQVSKHEKNKKSENNVCKWWKRKILHNNGI